MYLKDLSHYLKSILYYLPHFGGEITHIQKNVCYYNYNLTSVME